MVKSEQFQDEDEGLVLHDFLVDSLVTLLELAELILIDVEVDIFYNLLECF